MQATGRAGRDAALGAVSEMWVQTFQPAHPLYAALKQHDYPAFAAQQLQERAQAGLPPFSAQALVRADAKTQEAAQAFLNTASAAAQAQMAQWEGWPEVLAQITLYPAVPMAIQRVANVERAQMLVESPSRAALQRFLSGWQSVLHATRAQPVGKGLIRWAVDVDPLAILHDGLGLFHLKLPQRFAQCQCRECAQVLQLDVELRIVFHFAPGAAAYICRNRCTKLRLTGRHSAWPFIWTSPPSWVPCTNCCTCNRLTIAER
jgi:hypothetical protein